MKAGYKKLGKKAESTAKGYDMPQMKPTLHITDTDLPQIKDWKVGQTYKLEVTAKQTSLSQNDYDGKKTTSASFEIIGIEVEDR